MSDAKRAIEPPPADDDPTLLRQCTRCYEVRFWVDAYCSCGNPEFSLPPFPDYTWSFNVTSATKLEPAARRKRTTTRKLENDVDPEREEFIKAFEQKPGEVRDILIGALHPSKFQPRKRFDEAKIDQLAALMKAEGQLTDLIVRHRGNGSFEILAGERRLRAAKKLGWKSLRCKVVECTDGEARRKALFDNKGREDLTELEEIQACRDLLDDGVYEKQVDLATDLGITPATLSNRLRALELPKLWLDMISQEKYGLSITHSRPLLVWIERPAVLDALAKSLPERMKHRSDAKVTVSDLEYWCLNTARDISRPLKGYDYRHAKSEVGLSKKEAADPALDLQKVGDEVRAFNTTLWQQYHDAGVKRRKATFDKSLSNSLSKKPRKTEAELAEERAAQRAKDLYRHKILVLQQRIGKHIADNGVDETTALKLLMWFTMTSGWGGEDREDIWLNLLAEHGAKKLDKDSGAWRMALSLNKDAFLKAVNAALAEFWGKGSIEQWDSDLTPEAIEQVAAMFDIKFETQWAPTQEFLELLSIEDLWALDNKWGTHLKESEHPTKEKLIAGLLASEKKKPLPDFMRKLKAVRL